MPKKPSKTTLKKKADKLAGEACRSKGYCEAYEWPERVYACSQRLEWAHIKSRGICSIRHDPKNCVCLCNICHRYFTQNPDKFKSFIDWLDSERWDYLNKEMQKQMKPDYEKWIEYYKELPNEL